MKLVKKAVEEFKEMAKESNVTIEKRVEERISHHVEGLLIDLLTDVEKCESPIEKLLAIELSREMEKSKLNHYDYGGIFYCSPQQEITVFEGQHREKKYRVDFEIEFNLMRLGIKYSFVIECDGHEFHEKTKEQVARDKERDRNLMENGITVIRFTGSEIYNNPFKCATQAVRIIENYIMRMYRMDRGDRID